jgi:hypothetical protein
VILSCNGPSRKHDNRFVGHKNHTLVRAYHGPARQDIGAQANSIDRACTPLSLLRANSHASSAASMQPGPQSIASVRPVSSANGIGGKSKPFVPKPILDSRAQRCANFSTKPPSCLARRWCRWGRLSDAIRVASKPQRRSMRGTLSLASHGSRERAAARS